MYISKLDLEKRQWLLWPWTWPRNLEVIGVCWPGPYLPTMTWLDLTMWIWWWSEIIKAANCLFRILTLKGQYTSFFIRNQFIRNQYSNFFKVRSPAHHHPIAAGDGTVMGRWWEDDGQVIGRWLDGDGKMMGRWWDRDGHYHPVKQWVLGMYDFLNVWLSPIFFNPEFFV